MTDTWKSIERAVAALVGGVRAWNSDEDVDVLVPDDKHPEWNVEVKNLTAPSVAQLEAFLRKNAVKCQKFDPPLKNALVIKRKAGRGVQTPFLLVVPLEQFSSAQFVSQKGQEALTE